MKDFGNLNSKWSTCSVCSSRNHGTWDHQALNDTAPELLEVLKRIRKTIADSGQWWMDCPDRGGFDTEEIDAAIAKAEGK